MTKPTITPAETDAALHSLGTPPALGGARSTCPICRTDAALEIGRDGDHATFTCHNGCAENAIVVLLASIRDRSGQETVQRADPIALINEALKQGCIVVPGAPPAPVIVSGARHGTRAATFVFKCADGRQIELHGAAEIHSPSRFRDAVSEQLGVTVHLNAKDHRIMAATLVAIAQATSELDSETAEVRDWIDTYVRGRAIHIDIDNRDQLADVVGGEVGFVTTQGEVYLRPQEFHQYIRRQLDAQVARADLARRVAQLGFGKKQLSVRRGGKVIKGRYWVASLTVLDDETTPEEASPMSPLYRDQNSTFASGDIGDMGTYIEGGGNLETSAGDVSGTSGDKTGNEAQND